MESTTILTLVPVLLLMLKATAVLLVALALTTVMQRASATSRHLVWVASLLALLAIPALALWSPIRFAVLPTAWGGLPVVAVTSAALPAAVTNSQQARTGDEGRAAAPAAPFADDARVGNASRGDPGIGAGVADWSLLSKVAIGWAVVATALLGWLVYGVLSVRRIVGRATLLAGPAWQGAMIDIADRLELKDAPRLLRAAGVTMPFACGFRRPTIVLPDDCESWSTDRRTAVLLHELAHIRRHDIIGHTVGRVVCALYWFHPLAWTAARRLRAESERACDDLALSCGTRASDYAEHLLDIVTSVRSHATPSAAMAMATRSEFEGRMLAILDPSLMRTAPTRMQASTLAGGVMMFAIVLGSAVPQSAVPASRTMESARTAATPEPPWIETAASTSTDSASVSFVEARTVVSADTLRVKDAAGRADGVAMPRPEPEPMPEPMPIPDPIASPRTDVRRRVADMLRRSEIADSSARASVLARILRTDSAASLRRTAAWGLSEYTHNSAAVDALLYAVRRDASAAVREMAAWSLADASDRSDVASALAAAIPQERDSNVRETVLWSLGIGASHYSTAALAAIADAFDDDVAAVREMAAWAVGSAALDRAPAGLLGLLNDGDTRVRTTAAWAFHQLEDESAAQAIDAALRREQDEGVKVAMVRALAVMGEPAVIPLQRIIESSDARSRAIAIGALARGAGPDPWPRPRPRPRPYP